MKKTIIWVIAVAVTIATVLYQRKTGPTHPVSTRVAIGGHIVEASLPRSHGGDGDRELRIAIPDNSIEGQIVYKRYKTRDDYDTLHMVRQEGELLGYLPWQPPAGKLEYRVILLKEGTSYTLNETPVIIRYKGAVPNAVLIPHILFIFTAELFSLVAGLFVVFRIKRYKLYGILTLIFLVIGGFVLGPVIQKFAFGAFWTGFPFGQDLTDNKVLVAAIFWLIALAVNYRKDRPGMILAASVVFFLVNLIPHSMFGSELDYETGEVISAMILRF